MLILSRMLYYDIKRRVKDGFFIGYNLIFPLVMIFLLGYLTSESYGTEFTGYHYYTVVMLPFCVAMAMITAAYAGKEDAYRKTALRLLFSPVTKAQIVLAKLLSCTIVISLCNIMVLSSASLIIRLPIWGAFFPVILLLTIETFATCAIGLFIGLGMKNFIIVKNILNIPICAGGILAGSFYPIGTLNPKLNTVLHLSPLTWINKSIFLYVFDHAPSLLWKTAGICLAVGIIFTGLAVKFFKREEYSHGDLPGFDQ